MHPLSEPGVSVHDVIDHLAADHGQQGLDLEYLVCRHRQVIPVENQQIGVLAWRKRSQVSFLEEKGSIGARVCDQRLFAGNRLP
jgi:predicted acetyltransferase